MTRMRPAFLLTSLFTCACALTRPPRPVAPLSPAQRDRMLTRAEAAADLDSLLALVEDMHPAPYTVVSRDSVQRLKSALLAEAPGTMTRLDFAPVAQRLLAAIGDGHTSIYVPGEELQASLASGGRTMPFNVVASERGLTVSTSIDSALHAGDVLRRINGHSVDSLARVFALEIPAELETWRAASIASSFATRAWMHGVRAPYTVDVLDASGNTRVVQLAGASRAQLDSARAARMASAAGVAGISYRGLAGHVAYLDFFSMSAQPSVFRHVLDSLFDNIARDSARGVIVDLRRNGGGNSALGDELLSYLTDRSYPTGTRKEWKMSRRYRQYMASQASPLVRWLPFSLFGRQGARLFGGPPGKIAVLHFNNIERPRANARRLQVPFCVVIGPGTFSSAMLLANSIKHGKLAPLIGEPTGEPPNSFGEVYGFRLPLSGLQGQVSTARFTLDPDTSAYHRGVLPDIPVVRTAADIRARRDPALDRAVECVTGARN